MSHSCKMLFYGFGRLGEGDLEVTLYEIKKDIGGFKEKRQKSWYSLNDLLEDGYITLTPPDEGDPNGMSRKMSLTVSGIRRAMDELKALHLLSKKDEAKCNKIIEGLEK